MSDNIVEINNLSFGYKGRLLHKGINMSFPRGKVVAIMGGSGSGKTTLLRLIGGQLKPIKGEVKVDGEVVHQELMPSSPCKWILRWIMVIRPQERFKQLKRLLHRQRSLCRKLSPQQQQAFTLFASHFR